MKLYYITNLSLPTKKAFGYGIAKMCENFGKNISVTLVCAKSIEKEEVFDFYGVKKNFSIKQINLSNFYSENYLIGNFIIFIKCIFFYIRILFLPIGKNDLVYTRDIWILPFLRLKTRNVFLEVHSFSKKDRLLLRFVKYTKRIVVITNHLKRELVEFGVKETKIFVAPDAVDLDDFRISRSKDNLRKNLNLPLRKKIVLYSGNLYDWKGVYTLANASIMLPDDVVIVFVGGSDDLLGKFKKYVSEKNYKNIKIIGFKKHELVSQYLKSADVLVLPNSAKEEISKFETSPIKLFEYMASGVPIVSSDLPSLREILSEKNAFFVEADNAKSLASGIRIVTNNSGISDLMARNALEEVQKFTWQNRANNVLEFITKNFVKDTNFYNEESKRYSQKRYPEVANDYIQFFFKHRLEIVIELLKDYFISKTNVSLIEMGCADGIVLRKVFDQFKSKIKSTVGVDISSGMIEQAKILNEERDINYFTDTNFTKNSKYDLIIEIGVLNYRDFASELEFISKILADDGIYICSFAGKGSLISLWKDDEREFANFLNYEEYEKEIEKYFIIKEIIPCGLFTPFIWRIPSFARIIQPVKEVIMANLAPNLFHEKVYLLEKKPKS